MRAKETAQLLERVGELQGLHDLPGGLERRHGVRVVGVGKKKRKKSFEAVELVLLYGFEALCVYKIVRVQRCDCSA